MKMFFFKYKKLHVWLLADFLLLAAYFFCRGNRNWMNVFAANIALPLQRTAGKLCYLTSISVTEVLCVFSVIVGIIYVVWNIIAIIHAKKDWYQRAYSAILGAACAGLSVYVCFCLLWGILFKVDSFQDKSGIIAEPVAQADLLAVTSYFADQLAQAEDNVPRNDQGIFAVPRAEILNSASTVYDNLEKEFPFLEFDDRGVKPMAFSRLMSILDFTGVYCSFTGESNVNVDSPACLLPSTVAHELAHQRGIASEQECNFLAILASTTSGHPAYEYAGWLMGYIHLGNALYQVNPDAYWAIRESLPDTVRADLAYNNTYWDQFRGSVAQAVSSKVYDGMLKAYGDGRGIQSYGMVVDLLVAYYAI